MADKDKPSVNIVYESQIKNKLKELVKGQDSVIDLLAFIGHLYTLKLFGLCSHVRPDRLPKVNMLLTGPTGFGKTFIIKQFAEVLGLGYKKIDCTNVSPEGWKGIPLSEYISDFLSISEYGFGILHLDEFDKLGVGGGQHEDIQRGVQEALLDILDGSYELPSSKTTIYKNVNHALVILTGSFQTHRDSEKNKKGVIGFKEEPIEQVEKKTWKEKIIDLGFMHEFSSRIICSADLEKYTPEVIRDILENSTGSAYKKYLKIFGESQGLDDYEIDDVVEKVSNADNGMRELDSMLFEKFYNKRLQDAGN